MLQIYRKLSIFIFWPPVIFLFLLCILTKGTAQDSTSSLEKKFNEILLFIQNVDPQGYILWQSLKEDKKAYRKMKIINQLGPDLELSSNRSLIVRLARNLVHESVHAFNEQENAFAQLSNDAHPRFMSFLKISELIDNSNLCTAKGIATQKMSKVERGLFYASYLEPDFANQSFYLLPDELTAYAFGLNFSLRVYEAYPDWRKDVHDEYGTIDSTITFILFILRYFEALDNNDHQLFFMVLQSSDFYSSLGKLLMQSLALVQKTCNISELHMNDLLLWTSFQLNKGEQTSIFKYAKIIGGEELVNALIQTRDKCYPFAVSANMVERDPVPIYNCIK